MHILTAKDFNTALIDVGISDGDDLMIHSSLMSFGRPSEGINSYLNPLLDIIGNLGTLCVPTFTFDFIKSGKYHWLNSASINMGALSEAIRKHKSSNRTNHPMQSLSLIGNLSKEFAAKKDYSAYENNGCFDLIKDKNFKILLLGAEAKYISLSHLVEEKNNVPYRFMKKINGHACFSGDVIATDEWGFYARYLDIPAVPVKEDIIVNELKAEGKWKETLLNGVKISTGTAQDFCNKLDSYLVDDPYWMLENAAQVKNLCEKINISE